MVIRIKHFYANYLPMILENLMYTEYFLQILFFPLIDKSSNAAFYRMFILICFRNCGDFPQQQIIDVFHSMVEKLKNIQ